MSLNASIQCSCIAMLYIMLISGINLWNIMLIKWLFLEIVCCNMLIYGQRPPTKWSGILYVFTIFCSLEMSNETKPTDGFVNLFIYSSFSNNYRCCYKLEEIWTRHGCTKAVVLKTGVSKTEVINFCMAEGLYRLLIKASSLYTEYCVVEQSCLHEFLGYKKENENCNVFISKFSCGLALITCVAC